MYKEKPKKKKTPEVIQKEVKYQNFEQRPEPKMGVLTERGIYSKLNVPLGICVFEPYEPEKQIHEQLQKVLDNEKAKVKDLLVDTKVDLDYAYLFHPSLRVRFKYLDHTYETKLTLKDITEGVLLDGPVKPEVDKNIQKVLKSTSKPKSNLYLILNIVLLLSLCAMNFLYFDQLTSPMNFVMALVSAIYMIVVYIVSKILPKRISSYTKSELIKMNDALDFKKALKVRKQNQMRKRLPVVFQILGTLIALLFVIEVYIHLLPFI